MQAVVKLTRLMLSPLKTLAHAAALYFVMVTALPPAGIQAQDEARPQVSAAELVRQAVAHEIQAAANDSNKHLFRARKQEPRGIQTRLYVETTEAMAGMTIAYNDQPLTEEQQKNEENHLAWLAGSPDQLRKKRAREKDDQERTLRILRALPDAFRYEYDGTETSEAGSEKASLKKLKFTPNPSYSPPSRVEQVLQGTRGYLLIDPVALRIARIDGTLFRDVSFGWGIIGHLDKGGHFRVEQADIGDGSWQVTSMQLRLTGKIFLFKSITIATDEVFSDFMSVPADLSFAKGVDLLKAEQAKLRRASETTTTGRAEP